MHGSALILAFPRRRNKRGISQKAEGNPVARSDFLGKLSRRYGTRPRMKKLFGKGYITDTRPAATPLSRVEEGAKIRATLPMRR